MRAMARSDHWRCVSMPWTMLQIAPTGAQHKRAGAHPIYDPDLLGVYFDPAHHGPDDRPPRHQVRGIEPVHHLAGELLQPTDEQLQLTLCCLCIGQPLGLQRQRRCPVFQPLDAGLELTLVDQPLGIAVDQPADAAPEGHDLTLELGDLVRLGGVPGVAQAPAVLVRHTAGRLHHGADAVPHRPLERRSPRTGRLSQTAAPPNRCPSVPMQR